MLMPFDMALMLGLGAAMGFLGGLFGIGGGVILIPLLVLGFGMNQSLAQGTALVMMVPNLLIAWLRYSQRHPVPVKTAFQLGALACFTTWLVAHVATRLPPQWMGAAFSLFLMALSLNILIRPLAPHEDSPRKKQRDPRWMPLVGIVGGSSMGLLGVGGGLVATPIFSSWFGQRQTVAQSLSLALVAPSSIIALMTYSHASRVDWAIGLPLAAGGLFTVSLGVSVAHRLPEQKMRAAFAWMVLCTATWMLAKPWLLR